MSLINTIALPLFVFFMGLAALIAVVGWVYTMSQEARTKRLEAQAKAARELRLRDFVEELTTEVSCSDPLPYTLSEDMTAKLWAVHNQINHRELTR